MNDEWPPRLGERFPPVLRQQVIERSNKRASTAKVALIGFTILASLVICTTIVYGSMRQKPSTTKTITYTVSQHDTLWNIAAKYDPNENTMDIVNQIEQMNHLSDNDYLQVGQTLKIPVGR